MNLHTEKLCISRQEIPSCQAKPTPSRSSRSVSFNADGRPFLSARKAVSTTEGSRDHVVRINIIDHTAAFSSASRQFLHKICTKTSRQYSEGRSCLIARNNLPTMSIQTNRSSPQVSLDELLPYRIIYMHPKISFSRSHFPARLWNYIWLESTGNTTWHPEGQSQELRRCFSSELKRFTGRKQTLYPSLPKILAAALTCCKSLDHHPDHASPIMTFRGASRRKMPLKMETRAIRAISMCCELFIHPVILVRFVCGGWRYQGP